MLLAVLLGKEHKLALLGNIASGSQPLDGLETRLVRLPRHNAALVLHQVALLQPARCVGGTAVEHLLLGSHRRDATTTLLVVVAASQVVPAHHVILTGHHVVPAHHVVLATVLARHHVVLAAVLAGHHVVLAAVLASTAHHGRIHGCGLVSRHVSVHVVLPKQHIFFKERRVSSHRKRTVLDGPTDPSLQPLYIRNWI